MHSSVIKKHKNMILFSVNKNNKSNGRQAIINQHNEKNINSHEKR